MEKFSPEEINRREEERIRNLSPEYIEAANKERDRVAKLKDYELLNEVIGEAELRKKELVTEKEKAEEMSLIDELTGIKNRRALEKIVPEIMNIERRSGRNLSFLMIDIDEFKSINDNLGHKAGDEVLKNLPRIIGEIIRRSDFICRYGGDEYVIVLPDTDSERAMNIAEKIRKTVEEKGSYTLSIGVFSSEHLPKDKWRNYHKFNSLSILKEMIEESDDTLYKAKKAGRNIVVCHILTQI